MNKKVPVYLSYMSFGGGVDEYDVEFLTLEKYKGYHTNKLVGYLLPVENNDEPEANNA